MTDRHSKPVDKLSTYHAKRDPAKTPEPMGSRSRNRRREPSSPKFVIQEHHARALHWDLRLEHDGVFVSWALPKGLPISPSTNHLAVHTEDHPLQYGGFEGEIPKGEYGGGNVSIWDQGTYELEKWAEKEVMVVLHGVRAQGRYVLFPTGGKNWMIHRMDPAPQGFEPMPKRIAPMLAVLSANPPEPPGWAYEFKWDGVRALVFVDGGRVRATSRNDNDLTATFPELRAIGEFLGSRSGGLGRRAGGFRRKRAAELRPPPASASRRLPCRGHATQSRRRGQLPRLRSALPRRTGPSNPHVR